MTTTTISGKLLGLRRLNSSYYGNPKYEVKIDKGNGIIDLKTATDAMVGYSISNFKTGDDITVVTRGKKQEIIRAN